MRYFQIPQPDQEPSEALIEFLNEFPMDVWDGDTSGVAILMEADEWITAVHGDYIYDDGGVLGIVKAADFETWKEQNNVGNQNEQN